LEVGKIIMDIKVKLIDALEDAKSLIEKLEDCDCIPYHLELMAEDAGANIADALHEAKGGTDA